MDEETSESVLFWLILSLTHQK